MSLETYDVLESAAFIAGEAKNVKINHRAVENAAQKILPLLLSSQWQAKEESKLSLEPSGLSQDEVLEWIFLLDTLNFCFWSDESTLFTFSYGGVSWTGYRSLCAALVKAVQDGIPIYKPSFYGNISEEGLRSIFRSDNHVALPLLSERKQNLLEAAGVLKKEFDGKVSELIRRSEKSAQKLVSLLVKHFPSYRDMGLYRDREVFFLKRAQIFAADVWHKFQGKDYGEFYDINTLTMFADYRVPQCLQSFQVLEYSDELMTMLRSGQHLEAGGDMETEIRGSSIWAVELIRQRMCELAEFPHSKETVGVVNAVTIDYFLWNYAKSHHLDMDKFPIHKTPTIFY